MPKSFGNIVRVSQSNGGAFRVVIPKPIALSKGIVKGTELFVLSDDSGNLILSRVKKGDEK